LYSVSLCKKHCAHYKNRNKVATSDEAQTIDWDNGFGIARSPDVKLMVVYRIPSNAIFKIFK